MSEKIHYIITSIFAGIGGAFAASFISFNTVGYGFEKQEYIPVFVICGILAGWLTYRLKYIFAFDDLYKNYPNGVVDWELENGLIKSVKDDPNSINYSNKKKAVNSEESIIRKESRIREEYDRLKLRYAFGLRKIESNNRNRNKIYFVHQKAEIVKFQEAENKRIRTTKLKVTYDELSQKYPLGIKVWLSKNKASSVLSYEQLEKVCSEETLIKGFEINKKKENEQLLWKKEQEKFASHCRKLRNECLDTFGCYYYNLSLNLDGIKTDGDYKVWQMFPYSYCNEEDLDYTNFKSKKEIANRVKNHRVGISIEFANNIASFINKLNDEERTSIYFCPVKDGRGENLYFAIYSMIIGGLKDSYENELLFDPTENLFGDEPDFNKWKENVHRRIVIIDIATENDELKKICNNLIEELAPKRPLMTFISVHKCFDRKEMISIIERDQKKREEEAQQKEKEKNAKEGLIRAVSSWDTLVNGLHFSFLFYYYPTTCDFEATDEEWSNRWIVWNFKNTPGKTSETDHQEALDKAIPMLKNKLLATFENESLKYLTFVCIPASSQAKTQARYEEFSNRICRELGMINAYPYITVVSAKEEKHLGGTGLDTSKLHFDEDFFKDKYVLLFDDIITKGNSMRIFKLKMEALGAIVVGGLALGKTKHERPIQTDKPQFPFEVDDLPF